MFTQRRIKKELAEALPGGAVTSGLAQAHCRLRDENVYLASDGKYLIVSRPDHSMELHELKTLQRYASIYPYMELFGDAINDDAATVSVIFHRGGKRLTELIMQKGTKVDRKLRTEVQKKPRADGDPHTIGTTPRNAPIGEAINPDGQSRLVNVSLTHDGFIALTSAATALVPLSERPGIQVAASTAITCRYEEATSREWRGGLVIDFNHEELAQLRIESSVISLAGTSETEIEAWMLHYNIPFQAR
jgi:hypothetical protein